VTRWLVIAAGQPHVHPRSKNNTSNTGIGTPNSHSKIQPALPSCRAIASRSRIIVTILIRSSGDRMQK
jgi:hypothetical protein